jgi:hypothetical protein
MSGPLQISKQLHVVKPFTWYPEHVVLGIEGSGGPTSTELTQHPWQSHAAQLLAVLEDHVCLLHPSNLSEGHSNDFALLASMCAVGQWGQPNALAAPAIAAGFGSTEQQGLFGLLCSLLKCSSMMSSAQQTYAEECRLAAASAAGRLAQLYVQAHAAAGSTYNPSAQAVASSCVSQLLPWLVLFGRCCLQWAVQLQWRHQGIPGLPDAAAVQQAKPQEDTFMHNMSVNTSSDVFLSLLPQSGLQAHSRSSLCSCQHCRHHCRMQASQLRSQQQAQMQGRCWLRLVLLQQQSHQGVLTSLMQS